ncbi:MAG: UDP-2,3-diacylglucosamine diphosphatase [Alphaproteobacteria bacterium]|nr:UDP-2,3-diacylglucosamine diphosphatase [Alphaproteobacteria bacterium]
MSLNLPVSQKRRYRSVFVSDFHLGSPHCQAGLLLEFLRTHEAERIYLVGDIVDGWRLRKSWYWPQSHAAVLQTLLEKARQGTDVFYLPGNHDESTRKFLGRRVRNVEVVDQMIHDAADGRRYLVVHGDRYDLIIQNVKWLAYLGDRFYAFALNTNTWLNMARRLLGLEYWSLGAFAKRHVKSFVNRIGQYESVLTEEARHHDVQGVICGHIHHAENREMCGIHYLNTGDWVESCTAVVEHTDGEFEVIYWADRVRLLSALPSTPIEARLKDQSS